MGTNTHTNAHNIFMSVIKKIFNFSKNISQMYYLYPEVLKYHTL